MSILIKDMEMPENCCECVVNHKICNHGYEWLLAHPQYYDSRPNWCPLVEIPTPHGRLIDADALMELYEPAPEYINEWEWEQYMTPIGVFRENIKDAPTVIEAEEE